jgi:NAD(P)-dependent dehydrogenase (short-subunit alcohol dehydrogenase family)
MNMTGKVALVTGAGRGLGWGIAVAMARAGAHVLLTDVLRDDLARAVEALEREGATVAGSYLDAGDEAAVTTAVADTLARWGRLDAFVHAGVYMPLARFTDMPSATFDRIMQVGFGGFVYGARAAHAAMQRQGGGHLMAVASGSSIRGYVDEVAYCAMKHAVEGFAKSLALEVQGDAVAVNTVGPGKPIKPTRMTWEEAERVPEAERARWADPIDLGHAFVWLACQDPRRLTGLRLDAGVIVDTMNREGPDFPITPERVTAYPDDFRAREAWRAAYPG